MYHHRRKGPRLSPLLIIIMFLSNKVATFSSQSTMKRFKTLQYFFPTLNHDRNKVCPLFSTHQYMVPKRGETSMTPSPHITKHKHTESPYQLVIVESPSKASTISSILNNYAALNSFPFTFRVDSCKGHVRDLPESTKQLSNAVVYTPSIHGAPLDRLPEQDKRQFLSPVLGVRIADKSYDPMYIIIPQKLEIVQHLQQLSSKQNGCIGIILATDEDREGEAIAYHLSQILSLSSPDTPPMKRVTFNEITKSSIESAFFHIDLNERDSSRNVEDILDMDLVQAQETRRILDRIAGYPMSLVLCKKLAPGLSAGRVQSVGLSLIVNRERDRMTFVESEYWDIQAMLNVNTGTTTMLDTTSLLEATLIKINNSRIATGNDFDPKTGLLFTTRNHTTSPETVPTVVHLNKDKIDEIISWMSTQSIHDSAPRWIVKSIEKKERSISPPLPFTTSTLQQEANKRLGLSVADTMKCAQMLYEAGLISYMRTDSTFLSDDATNSSKSIVLNNFGSQYLKEDTGKGNKRRMKKGSQGTKFAQEAHEAIRPSVQGDGSFITPSQVQSHYTQETNGSAMPESLLKLYRLIYERTISTFMKNQIMELITVVIECLATDGSKNATFRASSSVVVFDGYTKISNQMVNEYIGNKADLDKQKNHPILSMGLVEGQELQSHQVIPRIHKTKPPPRYTEASFVQDLEMLGVGRPSTYASIVQTLKSRFYVGTVVDSDTSPNRKSASPIRGSAISASRAAGGLGKTSGNGPLVPSLSAFAVCSLLEKHCPTYVDPTFTARMEERLDRIADGENTQETRRAYLEEYYEGKEGLATQVEKINKELLGDEVRRVHLPTLKGDTVGIFIGPWGPYIKRIQDTIQTAPVAQLPWTLATDISSITDASLEAILVSRENNGELLGYHPDDGRPIRLRIGRFGPYLQWGEKGEKNTTNHSLPKILNMQIADVTDLDGNSSHSILSLEDAISYINLPRKVSEINGTSIMAGLGPYGPYLKFNNTYVGLRANDSNVLIIEAIEAEEIVRQRVLNKESKKKRGVVAELGEKEGASVVVKQGRFGTYINWKAINVKLPSSYNESTSMMMQLEDAWKLITSKKQSSSNGLKKSQVSNASKKMDSITPKPRRPMSAYLYFCAEKRSQVSKSVQSLSLISKELSKMWADLGTVVNGRKSYETLAAEARLLYERDMEEWKKRGHGSSSDDLPRSDTVLQEKRIESPKFDVIEKVQSEETVKMKRSPSAYMIFCKENRDKVSTSINGERLPFGEVTKKLAELWKACDAETKTAYQDKAETLKELIEQ